MRKRTEDDTLVVQPSTPPASAEVGQATVAIADLPRSDRYRIAGALAAGGMGEVLVAHDVYLTRDIVIKRMRTASPSPESVRRFLREARIQGRLEHPAIVPVHDLAVDPEGRPFFAMKQLTGTTLADVLGRMRLGAAVPWSRAQLLQRFVDICLAIELAHTRGVVHRDLKPANIALGDFGEVYVLDWGVARIIGDDHPDTLDPLLRAQAAEPAAIPADDWQLIAEAVPGATLPGAILGTPGYMAPEQLHSAEKVGPAADVYALGCMLFEILAGEPLHERGGPLASIVMGADARASKRRGGIDVSPELDAICVRATATVATDRYPSARALGDAVQRYLDGDRDMLRRRELADHWMSEAREVLSRGGAGEERRAAVRAAGRALALDPGSTEAAELVTHLVLSPPTEVPTELAAELAASDSRESRIRSRIAAMGLASFILYVPVLAWIGIRDWTYIAVAYALVLASVLFTVMTGRIAHPRPYRAWITMLAAAVLVATFSRLFGPFLLPAGFAAVAMAISVNHPQLMRHAWILFVVFLLAALGPWGLEVVGVLKPTYAVRADGYILFSHILEITPVAGQVAIAGFIVAVIFVIGILSLRVARLNREIRIRLEIQAWHLRQLVPAARTRSQQLARLA